MRRVVIESPYAGATPEDVQAHEQYALAAVLDCLARGESPYASHLLLTRVLDDGDPGERKRGIEAGLAWYAGSDACVVYADLGVSDGMRQGIEAAKSAGVPVEHRTMWR